MHKILLATGAALAAVVLVHSLITLLPRPPAPSPSPPGQAPYATVVTGTSGLCRIYAFPVNLGATLYVSDNPSCTLTVGARP